MCWSGPALAVCVGRGLSVFRAQQLYIVEGSFRLQTSRKSMLLIHRSPSQRIFLDVKPRPADLAASSRSDRTMHFSQVGNSQCVFFFTCLRLRRLHEGHENDEQKTVLGIALPSSWRSLLDSLSPLTSSFPARNGSARGSSDSLETRRQVWLSG